MYPIFVGGHHFLAAVSAGGTWAQSPDGSWAGDLAGWTLDAIGVTNPWSKKQILAVISHDSLEGTSYGFRYYPSENLSLRAAFMHMRWGDGVRLGVGWMF